MAEEIKDEVKSAPAPAAAEAAPAAETPAAEGEVKRRRVKGAKNVPVGVVHILASFNNTTVSITDPRGNVISWSSDGRCDFKGSRKSTAYVAQLIAVDAAKKAMATYGLREVEVRIKGPGAGRESAVRGIASAGLEITSLRDITPLPHNGCRPPKRRRV